MDTLNITLLWVCTFIGAIGYFLIKARQASKDAIAANMTFNLWRYIKADAFDIVLSLILVFVFMISGGKGINIPGLPTDISSYSGAVVTGAALSYVGVNYILGLFGAGNGAKKEIRDVVDVKTNAADGILTPKNN